MAISTKNVQSPWWKTPTALVLALAVLQRAIIFIWGIYQDATMIPRFTDVDYMVFTDASRFVNQGLSPYARDTYRYTPLLAWLLLPTSWWFFSFGKMLFIAGDIVAGYLTLRSLRMQGYAERQACIYASLYLLNPMVSVISARGSSEGLLGAIVIWMVWATMAKKYLSAGIAAGVAVHYKIYPIIYVPTIMLALGPLSWSPRKLLNRARISFALGTLGAFVALTGLMYQIYGDEYLQHSWLHHLTRLDHRHNFSPYSTVLYYASANPTSNYISFERWAFVPQLLLSGVVLPLAFARREFVRTMFVQTLVFVTFNKVCTSQYFMWYLVLLPFYVSELKRLGNSKYAFAALWVASQALWLRHGYQLEFLGESTFYPYLFVDTLGFFAVNVWGICILIKGL